MTIDKITRHDNRVSHCFADLNGQKYHYLLANPQGEAKGTVFLIHGWPDLSIGWRYQIPLFLEMGYRCVAPDMIGYGRTAAPDSLVNYGFKRAADDIKELANQLECSKIILGGHDWGGAIVYRVVLWHPELVSHLISVCTPYLPPSDGPFTPLETVVEKRLPQFRYQLHLASGEMETIINDKDKMESFVKGMYGGSTAAGGKMFNVYKGVLKENLADIGPSPLMSSEEVDYYVEEYMRNGIHFPLNWYRNHEVNYEDEKNLKNSRIEIPTLFIAASKDAALPPAMGASMDQFISRLTRMEVETSHWALIEKPGEVNVIIKAWLNAALRNSPKSNL